MKKLFLLTALTVLCCGSVFAQTSWVTFTSTTPQAADISLIESDNVSVEFSVDVFGMYKTDTSVSNMPFQRINTPGGAVTVTVGEPEMPYIRQLIAIPHCDDVSLTVNVTGTTSFSNYNVYPAPELVEVIHPDSSVSLEESLVYDSIAYQQNQITNADYGVVGMNNSIIRIVGDETANQNSGTQQFLGNESFQMHFTNNSFPEEIAYNIIWNGTNTNPLIYNDANPPSGQLFDAKYNCWDSHFSASNDLIPSGQYDWTPIWCPGTYKSINSGNTLSDDELLYSSAIEHIENGDYVTAESELKEIIADYPSTETAKNAVKQLFELENVLGADYLGLKNYYANEPNLQNNDQLGKLAHWTISYCNVELGEYQLAIDWYDNVIDTTASESDSTFAAIDMGEAALAASNGNKNAVSCKNSQFIFDTRKAFELNREYLINELLKSHNAGEQSEPQLSEHDKNQIAMLYQNIPNPFSSTSTIKVELYKACNIELDVLDLNGKKIVTLAQGQHNEGLHKFIVDTDKLAEGVYAYSLKIEGILFDSKKMLITK